MAVACKKSYEAHEVLYKPMKDRGKCFWVRRGAVLLVHRVGRRPGIFLRMFLGNPFALKGGRGRVRLRDRAFAACDL